MITVLFHQYLGHFVALMADVNAGGEIFDIDAYALQVEAVGHVVALGRDYRASGSPVSDSEPKPTMQASRPLS